MKSLFAAAVLLSSLARAEDFAAWEERTQFDCNAPFDHFSPPEVRDREGWKFEHTGGTVKVRRSMARTAKKPVLGLLAGIKDLEPETKAMIDVFIATFEKADVDAIVVGGDSSSEPDTLDTILDYLVHATNRPLLIIAGNMERGAALNYAVLKQRKLGFTHLLNLGVMHRYDGDGVDVVGLSGYHDKAFLHLAGGCIYRDKDLDAVKRAAAEADDTVVLLSHGPPRQRGQQALDYVPGADNVGDPQLAALVTEAKISFGIHGHILEAAGWGTDFAGKHVPQKKPQTALFVDQGSANPLPWKMNDGTTAYGLAALLTIDGKKGSYEILRGAKPKQP